MLNSAIAKRYEWLIRITTLILDQRESHPQAMFDIFVRELNHVLQFEALRVRCGG